eukprot:TRINITY_DN6463_c0_g1_i10.p1 TRINITY_DN6463_c0_g1~~TRINITY_DN6463_c0_g1_i10.p1  ORF type:complete len:170 (-),score=44.94 TRINITY_DN6463_c0_g1_i10:68-577(-)
MNVQMLSDEEAEEGTKMHGEYQRKKNEILGVIEKKRAEILGVKDKGKGNSKSFHSLSEAESYGTDLQNKSLESLQRSLKTTNEDIKIADDIEKKIQDNMQTLLAIEDERIQMDSTMARVKKHIDYFKRSLQTDKLLVCLVFTAILGIIAAVICYFAFSKKCELIFHLTC